MDDINAWTVVLAVVGTLGGSKAWDYYRRKLEIKKEAYKDSAVELAHYRDDLRERVAILESREAEYNKERGEQFEQN